MAEADRTNRDRRTTTSLPVGLLEALTTSGSQELRVDEVARGRRHAAARTFDDGAVVEEIASPLLEFSSR